MPAGRFFLPGSPFPMVSPIPISVENHPVVRRGAVDPPSRAPINTGPNPRRWLGEECKIHAGFIGAILRSRELLEGPFEAAVPFSPILLKKQVREMVLIFRQSDE